MDRRRENLVVAILVLLVVPAACRQLPPEERVDRLRAQYTAELNSISIEPAADEPLAATEGEEASEASGEDSLGAPEGQGQEDPAAEPVAVRTTVVLDILVSTESFDKLPGITLDVTQVDAERNEKDRRLIWIDTSTLERGPGLQYTEVLEDVEYREGDGFHVEVRSPIAEGERARYRELAEMEP